MMRPQKRGLARSLAMGACAVGAGCATPQGGNGGNGGNGPDPLAQYRLGQDENFDAVVREITDADNRILVCLDPDETRSFTDQEILDLLKAEFNAIETPAGTFDEFIVTIQTNEPVKADEICETELGADATFDANVARVTAAENRRAGCVGEPPVDDAESLLRLKRAYFLSLEAVPPIGAFANELAETVEAEADQACNP